MPQLAGAASTSPSTYGTIQLSSTDVAPGDHLLVTGTGWPSRTSLQAVLCGANAISGSSDCAVEATALMHSKPDGTVKGAIVVEVPPKPCPCVVLVTGVTNDYQETFPVTVAGVPTAPVEATPQTNSVTIRLSHLRVTGDDTIGALLGGSTKRKLYVTVQNHSSFPLSATLIGDWGRGSTPTNGITMPKIPTLAAGQSRQVRATFELGSFSLGAFTVKVQAQVPGYGRVKSVTATTSRWPVILFAEGALVVVLLMVLVAMIGDRVARRSARRHPS